MLDRSPDVGIDVRRFFLTQNERLLFEAEKSLREAVESGAFYEALGISVADVPDPLPPPEPPPVLTAVPVPREVPPAARAAGHDTRIADDGASQSEEEPMYSWIGPKPYKNHQTFRVWFKDLDGTKRYETFPTEHLANAFISKAQTKLVREGRPIEDVITAYVDSQTLLKPSSVATLRYRLKAITKGRARMPIEAFPWVKAWTENVVPQSGDSQHGILAALGGLVEFAKVKSKALDGLTVTKPKNTGKPGLHLDEARAFIATAIAAGDPLAMAAATMALTGLRPGEVMALKARDVDDGGALLWIEKAKTKAGRREVEVEEAFRPMLVELTKGKAAGDPLITFTPERARRQKDPAKARTDALLKRVRQLCEAAGVPEVVSHSLRGVNATLRKLGGASDANVTKALGWTSIEVGKRHYLAPGTIDRVEGRRAHGRLLTSSDNSHRVTKLSGQKV